MAVNRVAHLLTPKHMPKREKPEKVQLGTLISEDLMGMLQDYHYDSRIPITQIVEDALRAHLTRQYRTGQTGEDDSPAERRRKGRK